MPKPSARARGRFTGLAFLVLAVVLETAGALAGAEPGQIISQRDIREGYIAVTGGKVWFRIIGANRPGIPLLTIHGGPGGASDTFEALAPLADERPLILYDQLGCGHSDRPADNSPYTIERYVAELAQVRAALGLKPVHILAQSWGSMLMVEYLLTERPSGIDSVILTGPCLSARRWTADQRAWLAQMPKAIQETIARHEAAGTFDSPEYDAATKAYYREHLARTPTWPDSMRDEVFGAAVYKYMWGPSEFTFTGTLKDYERVDRLGEIHLPVLFTCGEFDEATPGATAYYQSRLPGAKLKVFPGASHMSYLEQPEAYIATVRDFLHSVEKR
jgi:proline iminopeptidase